MDYEKTSPPEFARPGYAADFIETDATRASFCQFRVAVMFC